MAVFNVEIKSSGGDIVAKQIDAISRSAAASGRSIVQLSKALNVSGQDALEFANSVGLSTTQAAKLVKGFQDLRKSGLSLEQTFNILQKEAGVSAQQFDTLVEALEETSKSAIKTIGNIDGFSDSLAQNFAEAKKPVSGFAKDLQDAANQALEFRKATKGINVEIEGIENISESVGKSNLALEKLSTALNTANKDTKQIISSITGFEDELDSITIATGKTRDEILGLFSQFKSGTAATEQFASALGLGADAAESLAIEMTNDEDVLQAVANRMGITTQQAKELADEINNGVGALGALIDDFEKAGTTVQDFGQSLQRSEAAIAAIATSTGKSEEEVRELVETFRTGNTSLRKFAESLGVTEDEAIKLVKAYTDAQYATNQLVDSNKDLASSYNVVEKAAEKTGDAVDGSVGNIEELGESAEDAAEQLDGIGDTADDSARSIQEGMELIAEASGSAFVALTAAGALATKVFTDFDKQLRITAAISGASEEEIATLTDKVKELGIETSATPQAIAELTTELSRAGFTADEQAQSLEGIIRASEATGEGLSDLGSIIGQIIRAFGLGSDEAGRIGDVLVAAANSTNTSVVELGEAFSYVSAQANNTNQPVEDMAIILGLLADAGLQGSIGGTSLAEAMRRISLASAGANSELNNLVRGQGKLVESFGLLEVDVRDANGQLLPMTQILDVLRKKFAEIEDQKTKEIIANALFGVQGSKAFLGILSQTEERVNGVSDSVRNSAGIAEESGKKIISGLGGAFTLLGSSLDTLLIELGEFLAVGIEPLVRAANELVKSFLGLPAPVQQLVFSLGLVTTALSGATFVLAAYEALQVKAKLSSIALAAARLKETAANVSLSASLNALAVSAGNASKGLLGLQIGAAGAGAAFGGMLTGLKALKALIVTTTATFLPFAAAIGVWAAVGKTWDSILDPAERVQTKVDDLTKAFEEYNQVNGKTLGEIPKTKNRLEELGDGFKEVYDAFKVLIVQFKLFPAASSISESAARGLAIKAGDLSIAINGVTGEFLKFKQANQLASAEAQNLIPVLEAALTALQALQLEGQKNADVTDEQIDAWAAQNRALQGTIEELKAAGSAAQEQGAAALEGAEDNKKSAAEILKAYEGLSDDFSQTLSKLDIELNKAITKANQDFIDNAGQREASIKGLEAQSLDERIALYEQHIQQKEQLLGSLVAVEDANKNKIVEIEKELNYLRKESAEDNKEDIAELESQLADLRKLESEGVVEDLIGLEDELVDLKRQKSEEAIEIYEEQQEAIAARREVELDKELKAIEVAQRAAEIAAGERIAAQEKIIESLDDESDILQGQIDLITLRGERQETLSDARLAQLDRELSNLQSSKELLERLDSTEASINEKKLIREELKERGIELDTTELELAEAIRKKEQEIRDEKLNRLREQQRQEKVLLDLQQEQQLIDLNRQVVQAEIAKIEAEGLVTQTKLNIKAQERLIVYKELELAAKRAEGAAESELIALEALVETEKINLQLKQSELPLAQRSLELAGQQLDDAKGAVVQAENLFKAQDENLKLTQDIAEGNLQAANNAEEFDAALQSARDTASDTADQAARIADGVSNAVQETKNLISATQRLGDLQGSVPAPGSSDYLEKFNQRADAARGALSNLPGLKTVSTTGQGTQYFIGDREVSESDYQKEIQSRKDLQELASKKIAGQLSAALTPADPTSYASIQQTIEGLERFQKNTASILKAMPGLSMTEEQRFLNESKAGKQLEILKGQLASFFTDFASQFSDASNEAIADEKAKLEALRKELIDKSLTDRSKFTQDELIATDRKIGVLKGIEQDRINEETRLREQAAKEQASKEFEIRREVAKIQNAQLTQEQIDAEQELLEFRLANEQTASEFELEKIRLRVEALKQVKAELEAIAKLQQLESNLAAASVPIAGARAAGGPVSAGLPYLVGEKRPELFVPKVPGTIVPRVPQIQSPSVSMARVEALLSQLVSRPVPQVASTANFYNQPNPIQTQVELLQSQLRASRTL